METINQGDLLWGMPFLFVTQFMKLVTRRSYQANDVVFSEGDRADYFYTLITGRVQLDIGETGQRVYVVDQAGEVFGWSSLMDRDIYSASAMCLEPTDLLLIEKHKLAVLLEQDPASGVIFFRNLAQTLGNRLLKSYEIISKAQNMAAKR